MSTNPNPTHNFIIFVPRFHIRISYSMFFFFFFLSFVPSGSLFQRERVQKKKFEFASRRSLKTEGPEGPEALGGLEPGKWGWGGMGINQPMQSLKFDTFFHQCLSFRPLDILVVSSHPIMQTVASCITAPGHLLSHASSCSTYRAPTPTHARAQRKPF